MLWVVGAVTALVAVTALRLLSRTKSFSKPTELFVVDPAHIFQIEMADELRLLREAHPKGERDAVFCSKLDALHATYHERALKLGWLQKVARTDQD